MVFLAEVAWVAEQRNPLSTTRFVFSGNFGLHPPRWRLKAIIVTYWAYIQLAASPGSSKSRWAWFSSEKFDWRAISRLVVTSLPSGYLEVGDNKMADGSMICFQCSYTHERECVGKIMIHRARFSSLLWNVGVIGGVVTSLQWPSRANAPDFRCSWNMFIPFQAKTWAIAR